MEPGSLSSTIRSRRSSPGPANAAGAPFRVGSSLELLRLLDLVDRVRKFPWSVDDQSLPLNPGDRIVDAVRKIPTEIAPKRLKLQVEELGTRAPRLLHGGLRELVGKPRRRTEKDHLIGRRLRFQL